jgi:hypothetical protein
VAGVGFDMVEVGLGQTFFITDFPVLIPEFELLQIYVESFAKRTELIFSCFAVILSRVFEETSRFRSLIKVNRRIIGVWRAAFPAHFPLI